MKKISTKKITILAILCAMSLLTFMIESLFPPLFLPGAKMGLSNIFSLTTLLMFGPVEALIVVVIRTTMGSIFTGSMMTLLYSLTAGLVSTIISSVLVELVYPRVSIIAISIISAVVHNVTQNVVFCIVSETPEMYSYAPWLCVIGVPAGILVGLAVLIIIKGLPYATLCQVVMDGKGGDAVTETAISGELATDSQTSDILATDNNVSYKTNNVIGGNQQGATEQTETTESQQGVTD